jgi:hypothetical protein
MTIVKHLVMAVFGAIFTFGILALWAIASDMARKENVPVAAISEMLEEANAGYVDEVKIHGTRYEYRRRGENVTKVAYGPKTTQAEAAKLIAAPRVVVE